MKGTVKSLPPTPSSLTDPLWALEVGTTYEVAGVDHDKQVCALRVRGGTVTISLEHVILSTTTDPDEPQQEKPPIASSSNDEPRIISAARDLQAPTPINYHSGYILISDEQQGKSTDWVISQAARAFESYPPFCTVRKKPDNKTPLEVLSAAAGTSGELADKAKASARLVNLLTDLQGKGAVPFTDVMARAHPPEPISDVEIDERLLVPYLQQEYQSDEARALVGKLLRLTRCVTHKEFKAQLEATVLDCLGKIQKDAVDKDLVQFMFIDDGSYSGNQLMRTIASTAQCAVFAKIQKYRFYVAVPFLTSFACEVVKTGKEKRKPPAGCDVGGGYHAGNIFVAAHLRMDAITEMFSAADCKNLLRLDTVMLEDNAKNDAYKDGKNMEGLQARTLTVFAHKLADEKSTLKFHLDKVGCKVFSCYKGTPWRNHLGGIVPNDANNMLAQVPDIGGRLAQEALLVRGSRGVFLVRKKDCLKDPSAAKITVAGVELERYSSSMLPVNLNDEIEFENIGKLRFDGEKLVRLA